MNLDAEVFVITITRILHSCCDIRTTVIRDWPHRKNATLSLLGARQPPEPIFKENCSTSVKESKDLPGQFLVHQIEGERLLVSPLDQTSFPKGKDYFRKLFLEPLFEDPGSLPSPQN